MVRRQRDQTTTHDPILGMSEPDARPMSGPEPMENSIPPEKPLEDATIPGATPPRAIASLGPWSKRLNYGGSPVKGNGGESSDTRTSGQSIILSFRTAGANLPNGVPNSSPSKNGTITATNLESARTTGKENGTPCTNQSPIDPGWTMKPIRAGVWYCRSEGCGSHNFAQHVSCRQCKVSRDGAAVVADAFLPSRLEPLSDRGLGATSTTDTVGLNPLPAASAIATNQGLSLDKDGNSPGTTQQSARSLDGEINTPAGPQGSDTTEGGASLDDGTRQQSSDASGEGTSTTSSICSTESDAFFSAVGCPSPPLVTVESGKINETRLPEFNVTRAPRPITPIQVESISKPQLKIESELALNPREFELEYRKPIVKLPSSPAGLTPTGQSETDDHTPLERLSWSPVGPLHVTQPEMENKPLERLPSSPIGPPSAGHKTSFSAQAQDFVPSPTAGQAATKTNTQSPVHSRQPSVDLGSLGTDATRDLSGTPLNHYSGHGHPTPQQHSLQGQQNNLNIRLPAFPPQLTQPGPFPAAG